jgi:hypothetical protein
MELQDIATAPKFVQHQAAHALATQRAMSARLGKIREIVIGRWPGRYVGEVLPLDGSNPTDDTIPAGDISNDVYVVEVLGKDPDDPMWTTVVHGESDRMLFSGDAARWTAILHAIAQIHSGSDSHATAAFYAGRVLGLPETKD